jgi:hypothetical protein
MYSTKFNDINKSIEYFESLKKIEISNGEICQRIEDALKALYEFQIINNALDLYGSSLTLKCKFDKKDNYITMEVID